MGFIHYPWWVIISPLWAPYLIGFIVIFILAFLSFLYNKLNSIRNEKKLILYKKKLIEESRIYENNE